MIRAACVGYEEWNEIWNMPLAHSDGVSGQKIEIIERERWGGMLFRLLGQIWSWMIPTK